jgi:hypothetical protein
MMHTTYRKDRAGRLMLRAAARRKRRYMAWRGIGKVNGIITEHTYQAREPYAVLVQEAGMLVRRLNDVYFGVIR